MPPSGASVLLDTHVWLWLVNGDHAKFGRASSASLRRAGEEGGLLLSVISVWEVAMLQARKRISLSIELEEFVERGLGIPGLLLRELTPAIAIESTRLPGTFHDDPADRFLVATARRSGAAIATNDARILSYARDGHVFALDAGR